SQLLDLSSLQVSETTIGRVRHRVTCEDLATDLARIGLWHDHGVSWEVHDYLIYNLSKAEVLARRERARQKKRRQRNDVPLDVPADVPRGPTRDTPGTSHHPVPVPVPVPQEVLSLASLACASTTEFDEFWKAYPRRIDKKKAQRAWAKLRPPPLRAILDAL